MAHWPLNQFPDSVCDIMQHEFSVMQSLPISVDFGVSFEHTVARLCNGTVLNSQGMIDVVHPVGAYSLKTKITNAKSGVVRITAHRLKSNHPYLASFGFVSNDPQCIGNAIIQWYNEKIETVLKEHQDFRTLLMVRSKDLSSARVCEYQYEVLDPNQFAWSRNKSDIYEAVHIPTGEVWYTWAPHTSHFEMQFKIPTNARKFSLTNNKMTFEEMHAALTLNPKNNPIDITTNSSMVSASETTTEPATTDDCSEEILRAGDIECSISTLPTSIPLTSLLFGQFLQGWVRQLLNGLSSGVKKMGFSKTGQMSQNELPSEIV